MNLYILYYIGRNYVANYGYCSADCTEAGLPEDGVNVVGVVLHTHEVGAAIRFRHIRNGVELKPIHQDLSYDFNYQQFFFFGDDDEIKLLPGDQLMVECLYDTTEREDITFAGQSMSL